MDRHVADARFGDDGRGKRLDTLRESHLDRGLEPQGEQQEQRVSRTAPYSMPGGGALPSLSWVWIVLFLCLRTRM